MRSLVQIQLGPPLFPLGTVRGVISVKKLVALAAAAGAAFLVWSKLRGVGSDDLWHEATTR